MAPVLFTFAVTLPPVGREFDTVRLPVQFVAPVTVRVCAQVTGLLNKNPPLEVNVRSPVFIVTRIRPTLLTPGRVKSM